jgi:hypothetical protein
MCQWEFIGSRLKGSEENCNSHLQPGEEVGILFREAQFQDHDAVDLLSHVLWDCGPWLRRGHADGPKVCLEVVDSVLVGGV